MPPSRTQRTTPGNASDRGAGELDVDDHVRAEAAGEVGLDEHPADRDVLAEALSPVGRSLHRERRGTVDGGTGVAALLDPISH